MADLTDSELTLALNGECHTVEVAVWLAREVKRWRGEQRMVAQSSDLTDSELGLALNGECYTVEVIVWLAREVKRHREAQQEVGATKRPEMPEIFPFVTVLHREVVLRPKDGQSEDIEMTPDEADRVAYLLRAAAESARGGWCGAWYGTVRESTDPEVPVVESVSNCVLQLSGNADIEIFPSITPLRREGAPVFSPGECWVILRHKDGESQDMVLTPDEALQVADQLRAAANTARAADR